MTLLRNKLAKSIAEILAAVLLVLTIALIIPLPDAPMLGMDGVFIITNTNVVDVETGEIIENVSLTFNSEEIVSIESGQSSPMAPGTYVIDGRGLYLLPGLWDMHTHSLKVSPQLHHPLFIRHGVTSVRDMSGCLDQDDSYWACPADRREWEQASTSGNGISPRYPLQSSYQANGGNEIPSTSPQFFRLQSFEDTARAVDFFASQGADFVKTYTELSRNQFANLSLAVAEKGLVLAGHKPLRVPLIDAIEAKMTSIEHGRLFMFECYKSIDSFRLRDNPITLYDSQKMREIIKNQDITKCERLMVLMGQSKTYWVPTLTTLKMSAMSRDVEFRGDSRLDEIPFIVKNLIWNPDADRASEAGYDDSERFVHEDYFEMASRQVATAKGHGVKILAGTDNIDTYVFSGSSLHDELSMLVQAGLSPLQALQSATIEAATFSGKELELGSIKIGKKADLILLTRNPLADINNTRSIAAVVFNGRYFDESALLGLHEYTIEMAQSWRLNLNYLANLLMSPLMRVQLAD